MTSDSGNSPAQSATSAPPGIIRVGLTEAHGMASEQSQYPPAGVRFTFLRAKPRKMRILGSPIKGYFNSFDPGENDLIEAVLSPIYTQGRWIYSLACFQEAVAFNLFGVPLPRSLRVAYVGRLFARDNFKKLIFWSQIGKDTLRTYGGVDDEELHRKSTVVYPAVREVADHLIQLNEGEVSLLFSGDFFRKGGVNVVDAYVRAQKLFPSIKLRVCCDEKIDFNTQDQALRAEYLEKIRRNPGITFGRVTRDEMVNTILPRTDIYLLPTYVEAFGFAILESMAFGIPVITTNHFAIPEMVEHEKCGYLIDTSGFDCDRLFQGYVVNHIPKDFREHVTEHVFKHLCQLIESRDLRKKLGLAGLHVARTKFSFGKRNELMGEIYREAVR